MAEWSSNWKSSIDAGKQRKYRYNAPLHIRGKLVSAHLSKELREKYGKRSVPLRKGDTVKIVRGKWAGDSGKIEIVDRRVLKVYVEGKRITKRDGTEVPVMIDPSNMVVTSLNLDDKYRIKKKEEKKEEAKAEKKVEAKQEKPAPKKETKEAKEAVQKKVKGEN